MGFKEIKNFISKGVQELYIARPDADANWLAFRHPDKNIPSGAKLTVRSDESAVFFRDGRMVGDLAAGSYTLDSASLPFLGSAFVNEYTGGNHHLAELFLVKTKEYPHALSRQRLGTFSDRESGLVVEVLFDVQFSLKVTDPVAFVTTLSGMGPDPHTAALELVTGRLLSAVQESVGNLLAEMRALDVVGNRHNDRVGREAAARVKSDFSGQGLEVTRFLQMRLDLDEPSFRRLREFGDRKAELAIQREGANMAGGFGNYMAVQANAEIAKGMRDGLKHGLPDMMGMGQNVFLQQPAPPPAPVRMPAAPAATPAPTLVGPAALGSAVAPLGGRWTLQTTRGNVSQLTARQVAQTARADGMVAETAMVRRSDEDFFHPASTDPTLLTEFEQKSRVPGLTQTNLNGPAIQLFEKRFAELTSNGRLGEEGLRTLTDLALASGAAAASEAARDIVVRRAKARGIVLEAPGQAGSVAPPPPHPIVQAPVGEPAAMPPPPPPRMTVYSYNDGNSTLSGISLEAVVQRVKANPEGVHQVWTIALGAWKRAHEVEEIARQLGAPPRP